MKPISRKRRRKLSRLCCKMLHTDPIRLKKDLSDLPEWMICDSLLRNAITGDPHRKESGSQP